MGRNYGANPVFAPFLETVCAGPPNSPRPEAVAALAIFAR